jgi:peptidoglycan/xylan/chitin deacetylase (PgdA/CDA1 family)
MLPDTSQREELRMQQSPQARDLLGYAGSSPHPHWPGGARVAVSIVVNFEEGAEFSVTDGDAENEAVYEIEQPVIGQPNPAIDSHFEYGSRAGWWRIMAILAQHNAPATVSSSGRAVERLPLLAQDAVRRGHEISAHGWRWEGHADLGEADERDRIARTVAAIKNVTGIRPVGWHTRSPGSASSGSGRRVPL